MPGARRKPAPSPDRHVNGLIFGPPGHGKTHLLGTAALDERTAPLAILDFEGGVLDVLTGLPGEGTDWVRIPIQSWQDFNEAYERLRVNDEGFRSCGIDSLSETHIFAVMNILEEESAARKDPDAVQQQDWGKALIQLRRLVRYFRDLPIHSFFTAHHKEEVDTREGLVKMVSLAGKAAVEIPGLMTFSGYLALTENEEGETQRVLLLQNYPKVRTKIRTPWGVTAPDELEDPTIGKILDILKY